MQEDGNQALEVVERVTQQFTDALSKQDVAALAQLYTEDALVLMEGREIKGREAIQKLFQELSDGSVAEVSLQVTEGKSMGDLAYGLGTSVDRDSQGSHWRKQLDGGLQAGGRDVESSPGYPSKQAQAGKYS